MKHTTTIAFMNHKGGVGKTTTAVNVGDAMARRGLKVLLVDLDAQSNLTYCLRGEESIARGIFDAMVNGSEIPIIRHKNNLYLIPSNTDLAGADGAMGGNTQLLTNLLRGIHGQYDFIIVDCAPGFNIVTCNAIAAADHIIVTVEPSILSKNGLESTLDMVAAIRRGGEAAATVDGVVVTRLRTGRKLHKSVERAIRANYGAMVFNTVIRETMALSECSLFGKTVYEYNKRSNGAKDYVALTSEIIKRYTNK